jgi:1-phosphofructokinase
VPNAAIVSVTLNPALDEAVALDEMQLGGTNRVRLDGLDPGGKGINASRVIHRLGRSTLALGFTAGYTGELLRENLAAEGVPCEFVEVAGLTRINVMIYESSRRRRTRMYLPGPSIDVSRLNEIREIIAGMPSVGIVILGGSLPQGLDENTYRDLLLWLHERNLRAILDTSGAALTAALGARPLLIKPNLEEAQELVGRTLANDDDILQAAESLRRRGPEHVVISLGERGAIATGPSGSWKAAPPPVRARSTVGSGDSMVAGLAIGLNEHTSLEDGLRWGSAAGAATAEKSGTQLGDAAEIDRLVSSVVIQRLAVEELLA